MPDTIPLIITMDLVVILKYPEVPKEVIITTFIVNNSTQVFCVKGVNLMVLGIASIKSNCTAYYVIAKEILRLLQIRNFVVVIQ